jgi:hypothetical protein
MYLKGQMISQARDNREQASLPPAGLSLGLSFEPEDGGHIFLRNVGSLSTDYMTFYHRN